MTLQGLSGAGAQVLLNNAKPVIMWDAIRAGRAIGTGLDGSGRMPVTMTDNDSAGTSAKWLRWTGSQLERMEGNLTDATWVERCLGPCGEFYGGPLQWSGLSLQTSKFNMTVVTPTDASSWLESATDFASILKNPDTGWTDHVCYMNTDLDGTNDVVVEVSRARSATYTRVFQVLVHSTADDSPEESFEMGWNNSAETRTTETPRFRKLPNTEWWIASILVAANATTAGYLSFKGIKSTGTWQLACAHGYNVYTEYEYVTRMRFDPVPAGTAHDTGKWDVHTTNAEVALRPTGWVAMSLVLPDRSTHVTDFHTNYAGSADYKFLGMLNLDCGLYRLRISMSATYAQVVVNLGTTAGVNFAYLNGPPDWNDFHALGIVATWEQNNGHNYATLFVNGQKLDSVADPADWFPTNLALGTMYIGTSGADGTPAESWIPRVAYGTNHMHRSYARTLSYKMAQLARGGIVEAFPIVEPPA